MPRKDFVDALRAIASKHDFDFKAFSHDWILQIRDPRTGKKCCVFGYTFDVNGAACAEICREKAATSMVLAAHGVANIRHEVLLHPARPLTELYVPTTGNHARLRALVEEFGGFPIVLKPLKGTGGIGVMKAVNWRDVEGALQQLFNQDHGVAVCPYKEIIDEYRCFVVDGAVMFTYRKVRNHVVGDGTSNVAALVARKLCDAAATGSSASAASVAQAAAQIDAAVWCSVPAEGEQVPLEWKHNLGQGATVDVNIPDDMRAALETLALAAADAVGARFCSADCVDLRGEGLVILEVNGGVMMDSLIGQLGDAGKSLAERVYESAVLGAMGLPLPVAALATA